MSKKRDRQAYQKNKGTNGELNLVFITGLMPFEVDEFLDWLKFENRNKSSMAATLVREALKARRPALKKMREEIRLLESSA